MYSDQKTQEKEITKVSENGDNGILAGEKVSTDDAHQGGTLPREGANKSLM